MDQKPKEIYVIMYTDQTDTTETEPKGEGREYQKKKKKSCERDRGIL